MSEFPIFVNILMMSDDDIFSQKINNLIQEKSNGVQFNLDIQKISQIKIPNDHDIYIIDSDNIKEEFLIKTIKKIKLKSINSKIILIGKLTHKTLKKTDYLGIKFFIEKSEDDDLHIIFDQIKDEFEHKKILSHLSTKANELQKETEKVRNIAQSLL